MQPNQSSTSFKLNIDYFKFNKLKDIILFNICVYGFAYMHKLRLGLGNKLGNRSIVYVQFQSM